MLNYEEMLAPNLNDTVHVNATWVAVALATALLALDRVTEALEVLDDAEERFVRCRDEYKAALYLRRAKAFQLVGNLERAQGLIEKAIKMVKEAGYYPEPENVAGYFNNHLASLEIKLKHWDFEAALDELEAFESGTNWAWAEKKLGKKSRRMIGYKGSLLAFRAEILHGLGGPLNRSLARECLSALEQIENISPADLLAAQNQLLAMRIQDDPDAPLDDLVERMEFLFSQFPEHGLHQSVWEQLTLATARARANRPDSIVGLRGALLELVQYMRDASLPAGVAASRYLHFRDAMEVLLEFRPEHDLLHILLDSQAVGRLWTALGKPNPSTGDVVKALCSPEAGALVYVRGKFKDFWVSLDAAGRTRLFPVPRLEGWHVELTVCVRRAVEHWISVGQLQRQAGGHDNRRPDCEPTCRADPACGVVHRGLRCPTEGRTDDGRACDVARGHA